MQLARFLILHTILLGLLVATYFLGWLPVLWEADKFYAIPLIGGLTIIGTGLVLNACLLPDRAQESISASLWLADKLPVVGLALTVIGLLWASNGVLEGDGFKRDVIHALVGNLMGVVSYAWVELVARVCR